MDQFWRDVRYGARVLLKNPGFTVVAVLTLALGIGATTTIFSVLNGVVLRPLPYPEPERLVYMQAMNLDTGSQGGSISPPDFLDYREAVKLFDGFAVHQNISYTLASDAEPERLIGSRVSAGFFETLRASPLAGGRTFTPDEEQDGRDDVAIVSHGLWQRSFGGDPALVGKALLLNGRKFTVVGIMPQGFEYPRNTVVWTPIPFRTPNTSIRRFHFLRGISRLKPNVTLAQAQEEVTAIGRRLEKQYPDSNRAYGTGLTLLSDQIIGEMRQTLWMLTGAVGFLLLIACANVANLSLARGAVRGREMAIRAALGAGRRRVIRQLLTESALLAVVGGSLGFLLAVLGVKWLVAASPSNIPRLGDVSVDWPVLGFSLAVSLFTSLLFGMAPALAAARPDLTETLKEGGRGSTGGGHHRLRSMLVVSEVALALVLLAGATLLSRSFLRLLQVDPGFQPARVLAMQIALPPMTYSQPPQRTQFLQQLIQRVEALPGVQAVGTVSELPMSGQNNDTSFALEGQPLAAPGVSNNNSNQRMVSSNYFQAMSIPLIKGRFFTDRDNADAPKVAIVSESFVRQFLAGKEPLGQRIIMDFGEPWTAEIVGVVGSIHQNTLAAPVYREMYTPALQRAPMMWNLVVRGAVDPSRLTAAIKSEVRALDKNLPIFNVRRMEERVAESAAQPRLRTTLLGIFAGLAVLLAAVGIYGVISYSVTQRTHELGIRKALGAQAGDVLGLVVRQGMALALLGVAIGLAASFGLARVIQGLLFGVSPMDPWTFISIPLLLALVALSATLIPAWRATRVDPIVALRYE
jgi:putative ABC transport system permease protein